MEDSELERRAHEAGLAREAQLAGAARRRGGIVHTPAELARFVARSIDALLRSELDLRGGIGDPAVALIDPACGPGAFFAAALSLRETGRFAAPLWGYDLDPAAIDRARGVLAPRCGPTPPSLRLQVADTVGEVAPATVAALAPVPVVIGNPPWIASAQAPPAAELSALLQDFRRDHEGRALGERKLGVLADAYVRFMRWGAEVARLGDAGGVLALVTNNSYLDGVVHRGLRAALMRWFERIAIVDLGGNALLARRGRRDGNVFGVRTGAAVLFAVRGPRCGIRGPRVSYVAPSGDASEKLRALCELDLQRDLAPMRPAPPLLLFTPHAGTPARYARWPSLSEAMPFHREGVQSNRDAIVVDRDRDALLERLVAFARGRKAAGLAIADRELAHYRPERARRAVAEALERDPDGSLGVSVRPLAYRPFDSRFFTPVAPLCHRPRPALLQAVDGSLLALVTVRKDRGHEPWSHAAVATHVIDNCFLSTRSSCRARAFPSHRPDGEPNLEPSFAAALARRVGRAVTSVDFIHYALAVLSTPSYRRRYAAALRCDYPRIPWPGDAASFDRQRRLGIELARWLCGEPEPVAELVTIGHHRVAADRARLSAIERRLEAQAALIE